MKFSIIVPTLNSEKFLRPCLESIFNQSYKNVEVIVVDGYSKDGTRKIIKEYEQRYPKRFFVAYRRPQGEPDAINAGMELTSGDILAFIDADDIYEPNCFATVAKYFKTHHKAEFVFGKARIIDKNQKETRSHITSIKSLFWLKPTVISLLCVDYIVQPTVFCKRSLFKVVDGFDVGDRLCFDYEYWLRLGVMYGYELNFINDYLASWRIHPDAVSPQNQMEQIKKAFEWQRYYAVNSGKGWLLPIQVLVYGLTKIMYSGMGAMEKDSVLSVE